MNYESKKELTTEEQREFKEFMDKTIKRWSEAGNISLMESIVRETKEELLNES